MAASNKNYTDNEILAKDIMKHFDFLVKDYHFIKYPEYRYVREIHNDFVRNDLIIKLHYEGSFELEILKPKINIQDILNQKKRTVDFDYNQFDRYDLKNLDLDKKIHNSVSSDNFPDKDLWYFAKLLKKNPEILDGNLNKLKWIFRLLKRLKKKTSHNS